MRNALVVLVPVCIGLSSGFIVPSSIQEMMGFNKSSEENVNSNNTLQDNEKQNIGRNNTATKNVTEGLNVENMNKDIFEDTIKKESNLTERSFIYLKNQWSGNSKGSSRDKSKAQSFLVNFNDIFDEVQRHFSLGYVDKNIASIQKIVDLSGRDQGQLKRICNSMNPKNRKQNNILNILGLPVVLVDSSNNELYQAENKMLKKIQKKSFVEKPSME